MHIGPLNAQADPVKWKIYDLGHLTLSCFVGERIIISFIIISFIIIINMTRLDRFSKTCLF